MIAGTSAIPVPSFLEMWSVRLADARVMTPPQPPKVDSIGADIIAMIPKRSARACRSAVEPGRSHAEQIERQAAADQALEVAKAMIQNLDRSDERSRTTKARGDVSARMDRLAVKMDLHLETRPFRAVERKAEIEAAIAAGDERLAAMAQAGSGTDEREVALDQRERQIKIREFQFGQKVDEATGQLRASYLKPDAS